MSKRFRKKEFLKTGLITPAFVMKRVVIPLAVLALFWGTALAQEKAQGNQAISDPSEKVGYSVGYQLGAEFKLHKISVSPEALIMGFRTAMGGEKPMLPMNEMRSILIDLQKRMRESATLPREGAPK